MREILVDKNNSNQRLDKFILKYLNTAPKSFVYKIIRKKYIKLNGLKVSGNEILQPGDKLNIFLSDETIEKFISKKAISNSVFKPQIIFEDENVLICSKPAGVLTYSTDDKNSMLSSVLAYLNQNNDNELVFTPAFCNRLDRNTSGLLICGKNFLAMQELNRIMKCREIQKFYLTIVCGKISEEGNISSGIVKNKFTNKVSVKDANLLPDDKKTLTRYVPLRYTNKYSLLNVELVTGKTHQIRAHFNSIHHPVVGDNKYGNSEINLSLRKNFGLRNQLLHAHKIIFKNENGILNYLFNREFIAPLPNKFKVIKEELFY